MGFGITNLLANDGYVIVNRSIIKKYGINEAIMLGELCSEYNYWASRKKLKNGWFFSSISNVEINTCLTGYKQREALKILEDAGIIKVVNKGLISYREIDKLLIDSKSGSTNDNFHTQSEKNILKI